jgi:hypothetical protein
VAGAQIRVAEVCKGGSSNPEAPMSFGPGCHKLRYDARRFDFAGTVLEMFNAANEAGTIASLEDVHLIPGISDDVEHFRQLAFAFFRTPEFQRLYQDYGAWLIDQHFGGEGMIQKTPTVRIQLPGAPLTSFHTDGWYGHGEEVRSFWLPLTRVEDGNTLYVARDPAISRKCQKEILDRGATLREINRIARPFCEPLVGGPGDAWTFCADTIHGADRSTCDNSRVSFDFRVVPAGTSTGIKPTSNYFDRSELNGGTGQSAGPQVDTGGQRPRHGLSYSNRCDRKSAKAQLMLVAAYAEANGIGVVTNEAEIIALPHLPVLRSYLSGDYPDVDCVVTFGLDIFEGDRRLAGEMLDCADAGKRSIFFAAEGLAYHPGGEKDAILARV